MTSKFNPTDVTESINIKIDDDLINNSKCFINAYSLHVSEDDAKNKKAYNPKTNPDKAFQLVIIPENDLRIDIFLKTKCGEWDSLVEGQGKLTPDQLAGFFKTDLFKKLYNKLSKEWPTEDKFYARLLECFKHKQVCIDPPSHDDLTDIQEDGEFRKGNIDINKSRGTNTAGQQIYTNSGRKIVSFSDFGLKKNTITIECWPKFDDEFKWSQWRDWENIRRVVYIKFFHNEYEYGLSLAPLEDDDKNRGFRSYNLTILPHLQWCTPIETKEMLNLSLIQKINRAAVKRIKHYIDLSDEEIYKQINNPEHVSIEDIQKTKKVLRNSIKAILEKRNDTFMYD